MFNIRDGGKWKNITKAYLRDSGKWKKITKAYIRDGGKWKIFFGFLATPNEPSIAQTVTLVTSSASMPATLTGRNYRWTNATVLTYKFQYNNGSQWVDGNNDNATGTITNPSVGSSNTKTYTPILADFSSSSATSTAQFRFVVTATNTNVSPSLQTVSTSNTVSVENTVAPVIPTISMAANTGITQTEGTINWTSTNQASFSSTGTFSGTGTTGTSISKTGLTAGITYTGTVTVTSSTGNTASANYSIKMNDPVAAPVNQTDPVLTQISANGMSVTSGSWTNNPTSYRYRWYELVNNDSIEIKRDITNSNTSDSYSGTQGNDYLVQVTASNSGGSASEFSNVLPLKGVPSGGSVSLTGGNTAGSEITALTSGWSNDPTSYSLSIRVTRNGNTPTESSELVAFSTTDTVKATLENTNGAKYRAFATAANIAGTSSSALSGIITVAAQYTVSWNANGGTVSPTSNTVNAGVSVTAPTPTRSGFTFAHWRNPPPGVPVDPIIISAGASYTPTGNITFTAIWTANPACTEGYLPYGDWEYKDSNGNDTSWSACVNGSQSRDKRRPRDYQNSDCTTSGPYYEYGTDTQSCTVTCTAGCGSYGDIVYGTYTSCVNCSKSRTRSQTRTCTNTDCTTYPDTLTLTPESTSCSCTAFTGAYGEYTAWSAYGSCTAVGCLAVKFRSRTRTRNVGDACCNITTQTQTQEESAYCNVTRYTCSNFDVTNSNSVNYFDCFSVGACTARYDPQCVRTACQFS